MAIIINNLSKDFQGFTAVDDLSLKTKDNGIFALLGLNGAGKTTTINILCSLLKKTSGQVIINGFDLDKQAKKIKKILLLAPQESCFDGKLTVEQNLNFMASLYKIKNSKMKISRLINFFNLQAKAKTKANNLSGGQQRKLSLAMSMVCEPKILILDEPTLGMDVVSRQELWTFINSFKKDMLVVFTTHYIEEAEKYADDIAIISAGKIVAKGTKQEIIKQAKTKNFTAAFIKLAKASTVPTWSEK